MPEITSCPKCQRKLRVPDDLIGRKVKCPGCGINFTAAIDAPEPPPIVAIEEEPPRRRVAPAPPPPPPVPRGRRRDDEDDYDDDRGRGRGRDRDRDYDDDRGRGRGRDRDYDDYEDDRPRRRSGGRQAWATVKVGAIMNMIAMIILSTVMLIFLLVMLIAQFSTHSPGPAGLGPASGNADILGFMVLCNFILLIAWRVLAIIGYAFYLSVPPRVDARNLAMVSLCTAIGSVVVAGLGFLIFWLLVRSATSPTGGMMAVIVWITTVIIVSILILMEYTCGIIFCRSSSEALREHNLASNFTYQLISMWVVTLMYLMYLGAWYFLPRLLGSMSLSTAQTLLNVLLGCGYIMLLASLGWSVWHTIGLFLFRGALDAPPRRGRD